VFAAQLSASAPALEITNKDQIAALPIGSRIRIEPWEDNINFVKAKPLPLTAASVAGSNPELSQLTQPMLKVDRSVSVHRVRGFNESRQARI
ncbi:MAG: hypothetical protein WBF01_05245, partial [Candidatus Acidiferrum sp.]